jgi:hypothetical protein
MRFSDKALYAAKHRGRNRVVLIDMLADVRLLEEIRLDP